jgi:2'-5' RNA ligase
MHSVVSLFDEHITKIVQDLWVELANDFGVRQLAELIPYPHVSYHVAQQYEEQELVKHVEALAWQATPFQIQTTGLALFTSSHLVLYVPIIRTLELSQFHQNVWQTVIPMGSGTSLYYQSASWVPHITLAEYDINPENLARILAHLSSYPFRWDIMIDNLAILWNTGIPQEPHYELRYKFPFQQRRKVKAIKPA